MGILLWLFVPTLLLLGIAVFTPKTLLTWLIPAKFMLIGLAVILLLSLPYLLHIPGAEPIGFLVVNIFPYVLVLISILLFAALSHPQGIYWKQVGAICALFVILCGFICDSARVGRLVTLFVFAVVASALGVVAVASLWFAWKLVAWRKLAALATFIFMTAGLLLSARVGSTQSPEDIAKRNGTIIVQTLETFYQQHSVYPEDLSALIPEYLIQLPDAVTTQGTGWLYISTGDGYTLGYWDWPDNDCVMLYTYSSVQPMWKSEIACGTQAWGPFNPIPTPMPTALAGVCPSHDCADGLHVNLIGDVPDVYTIELKTVDGEPIQFVCPIGHIALNNGRDKFFAACEDGNIHFGAFLPDELSIIVSWDGHSVSGQYRPEYQDFYPNGRDCPPKCRTGILHIALTE